MYYVYMYERMTQEPVRDLGLPFHSSSCFKTGSAWQLTKAWSQNIIKFKPNLMQAEIKHLY